MQSPSRCYCESPNSPSYCSFLDILHLGSSLEALEYLQSALSAATDPLDVEEQRDLKTLFTMLVRRGKNQAEG
jgi:hypothetical protein